MNNSYLILAAVILFITYSSIIGLLLYYFIKHRTVWDTMFNNLFIFKDWGWLGWLECPEHCILPIPGILFSSSRCNLCKEEKQELECDTYQLELLGAVHRQLNSIINHEEIDILKHILEYSIRNYKDIRTARIDVFETMLTTAIQSANTEWQIEDIPILEARLQAYQVLLNKINTVGARPLDKIPSTFILGFIIYLQKTILADASRIIDFLS